MRNLLRSLDEALTSKHAGKNRPVMYDARTHRSCPTSPGGIVTLVNCRRKARQIVQDSTAFHGRSNATLD